MAGKKSEHPTRPGKKAAPAESLQIDVRRTGALSKRARRRPELAGAGKVSTPAMLTADDVATSGKAWVAKHAELLSEMPSNLIFAINVVTGEYVLATDGVEVMDLFEKRFPGAFAWVHHNNGPIRVGGWL
jgi:hypothetical protein